MTVFTEIDPVFLLPDEVWQRVKVAIPPEPPSPKVADREWTIDKPLIPCFTYCEPGVIGRLYLAMVMEYPLEQQLRKQIA